MKFPRFGSIIITVNEKQAKLEFATYTDVVLMIHERVKDLTDDNKCEFHANLSLYLEGLEEDVTELENGREVRHIPVRPKDRQDRDPVEGIC